MRRIVILEIAQNPTLSVSVHAQKTPFKGGLQFSVQSYLIYINHKDRHAARRFCLNNTSLHQSASIFNLYKQIQAMYMQIAYGE